MVAGAATGAAVGEAVAGPVGVVVGGLWVPSLAHWVLPLRVA